MRIATWNCARGPWSKKRPAAESLGADVVILTEAPAAAASDGLPWFGPAGAKNGTTILTSRDYRAEVARSVPSAPCVNAVRVSGPVDFTVLLVWTWPATPHKNYKQPLIDGLAACRDLPGPFVIAGDFNGNVGFDRPRSRLKWADCFHAVGTFDVISAYHAHVRGGVFGNEPHPTQYQTRKEHRKFHLDYVFVPTQWRDKITAVEVPGFAEFNISDHRPVIVTLDLA